MDPSVPLRLLLVNDTDRPMRQLREAFASAGYRVIAQADGAAELLRLAESQRPDVIIVDTESPTRDTLEQLALMDRAAPRPVVMFAGHGGLPAIQAAVRAGVTAYIVDHVSAERLAPIIDMARVKFEEDARLKRKLAEMEQRLADRKLIERAKGILMRRRQLDEEEAYALLRSQAMKSGLRLTELSRQLIHASELLD
ncbi:ANTAR domain-containing response regulator [Chromobacterium violaceum]|uniref:ANTAR domain-containing response regulator n=1 Tax=Chromobacterium violaceum TaxID=536 RepID=UPI0009DB4FD7|nr:ANTAR domain-containing protein [Chromobacterium violaceum]ATP28733.1 response regulator [Chromobacterium violaceum]ATP32643.1 response regulator [Chromobacterium violaceum]MBX9267871.1 ANTAR domain-containing protein [Chromobacterium violaceum]OQS49646.1 response regulator [Chromobacterium violaceum]OQS51942.1 response regulator [Chromobacterium violaceum]